ncbi:TfoX/Sxy family protein [Congzhengia minquanensis]|uniref:TfoX/Sxy family protein n=1 Tax=Congzhengia minquanensis TaxID=2763657 RepID=A0A926DM01_9FIRM|nr:TfoX/Sxy family protein [Congzhengia minquanensis]MBC8540174.1 TfoX/Sxy family protein [Congzhengia minquanensis]
MASSEEFVQFACEQASGAGEITYRKMFGEYGVYCDGKLFALICGDQFFLKITDAGRALCPNLKEAPPYDGAKPYFFIEDLDDRESLTKLVSVTCAALPPPRPKKVRAGRQKKA